MSAIQLDLSRQKLYVSPDDPLPEFYPPPRAILVTPIYDTLHPDNGLSEHPEFQDSNQHGPYSPWIVNRTSDSNPQRYYQASPSKRYNDHPYASSPGRDRRYDSDIPYYPQRDRHSRDRSKPRRRSDNYDYDDRSDYDHPHDDYYDDRSDRDYSSEVNHSSDDYRRPPLDHDRPPLDHDRPPLNHDHSPHQSSSQPHLPPTNHESRGLGSTLKMYLERNRQAACRDPFQHLKMFPDDIQKVLKALPPSPHFCWSECTGRRKAVCIGVNYVGQKDALKGCGNDARRLMSFLINYYGFNSQDIFLLTDDGQQASMTPTRENMLYAMNWLVKDAKMHDSLVFHYSGHGGQVKDETGTEADGMDEVIFPVDFKSTSHIVDNELFKALVAPLPTGCRLTAVFDSCHSGTVLDLPYLHSAHGRLRGLGHITRRAKERGVAPNPDVICLAACKDDETSADSFQGGIYVGAMSYALFKILKANAKENTHLTYGQILQQLRKTLIPKFNQKAQLSGTHPVDLEREFSL